MIEEIRELAENSDSDEYNRTNNIILVFYFSLIKHQFLHMLKNNYLETIQNLWLNYELKIKAKKKQTRKF